MGHNKEVLRANYIVNVPQVLSDAESEDGFSSDSDDDMDLLSDDESSDKIRLSGQAAVNKEALDKPTEYFRLSVQERNKKYRGRIVRSSLQTLKKTSKQGSIQHKSLDKLLKIFREQGFADTVDKSKKKAKERLGIVIGYNRMRSLRGRNQKKFSKLSINHKTDTTNAAAIKFLWDGRWQYKVEGRWKGIGFGLVKTFYKKLKRVNRVGAHAFAKAIESARHPKNGGESADALIAASHARASAKSYQIPYREIRETIKDSDTTKRSIAELRQKNPSSPTYLAIFDADIASLRAKDGLGVFSHYNRMCREHADKYDQPLEVASVGYRLPSSIVDKSTGKELNIQMDAFAVELDLWRRHSIAQIFKDGVYYPEPTTIVRVEDGNSTVVESFCDEGDYASPQEMMMLIGHVKKKRKLNPEETFAFDARGAIQTQPPARMLQDWHEYYNKDGSIVLWARRTFIKAKRVSQSHYHPNNMLLWLKKALVVESQRRISHKNINATVTAKEHKDLVASVITRVFNNYDPVTIATRMMHESDTLGFQQHLVKILKNPELECTRLMPITKARSFSNRGLLRLYQYLDNITTMSDLCEFLKALVGQERARQTIQAAQEAGQANYKILHENLELRFPQRVIASLIDLYKSFGKNLDENIIEPESSLYKLLFDNESYNLRRNEHKDESKRLIHQLIDQETALGFNLTHWAAIAGKLEIILEIKKLYPDRYEGWLNQAEKSGVTPLHLGLKYCAENGVNIELLTELITPENVKVCAKGRYGNSVPPVIYAMTELENPMKVVQLFLSYYHIENQTLFIRRLKEFLSKLPYPPGKDFLLLALYVLPKGKMRTGFIKQLVDLGAVADEFSDHIDLDDLPEQKYCSQYVEYGYDTYPTVEAMAQGDVELYEILADSYTEVCVDHEGNPYRRPLAGSHADEDGRTALWMAMENLPTRTACRIMHDLIHRHGVASDEGLSSRRPLIFELISTHSELYVDNKIALLKALLKADPSSIEESYGDHDEEMDALQCAIKEQNDAALKAMKPYYNVEDHDLSEEEIAYLRSKRFMVRSPVAYLKQVLKFYNLDPADDVDLNHACFLVSENARDVGILNVDAEVLFENIVNGHIRLRGRVR